MIKLTREREITPSAKLHPKICLWKPAPRFDPFIRSHHRADNCFGRLRILFGHELDPADARTAPFCRNDEGRRELNSNVRHVRPGQALPTFRFSGFWQSYAPLLQQYQNASIIRQRCTGLSPGPAERKHQTASHPWWASSLREGFLVSVHTWG